MNAIVRELRNEANKLSAGKRRDVNNKLDKILLCFKGTESTKTAPVTYEPAVNDAENFSTQANTIYNYLMEGHRITSNDALRIFGVARLASRICDIERKTGITPSRRRIQVTNRFGKEVYVNEYWIEQGE